ncbi:Flagellar protein FliO [Buchnera aphidicola (Periphyllus testudinaceus)]|uniref:flagellar biosynthetic protein FliO n=1 Tax=Buchnera aphidicola TaxID=9 RepID=UPI003463EA0C
MKTPVFQVDNLSFFDFISIDCCFYIIITLFAIFFINRYFYLKKNQNNSFVKILSTTYLESNKKIIVIDVKNVRLILGVTPRKIVNLYTFSKIKNKINKK